MLASYNFEIPYRPGKMSEKLDNLSRRSNHNDIASVEQVMISTENFKGFSVMMSSNIIAEIKEALEEDKSLKSLIESTKGKEDLLPSVKKQFKDYNMSENLLWYQGRIVIPDKKNIILKYWSS
jgi:hypothetical protein